VAGEVKTAIKTELSFLAADRLVAWLEALADGETQLLVPSKSAGTFVPWVGGEPDLRGITATSSKSLVLPQHETFLSYKYGDGGSVEVTQVVDDARRVVFGARLCDMHGLRCIDQTFGETGPSGGDPNYMTRRERTTFIAVACTSADVDGACFCATFFSPDSYGAADVVVHPVEGGFVLRPLTEKGVRVADLAVGGGGARAASARSGYRRRDRRHRGEAALGLQ
jgi:sulfhydrogenase subunit beta (sulfur reductase)